MLAYPYGLHPSRNKVFRYSFIFYLFILNAVWRDKIGKRLLFVMESCLIKIEPKKAVESL